MTVDGPLLNDTISYSFDQDGRLTSRDIYGTAENYNYNQSTGQLVQVSNPLGTFDYSYDAATPRLSKVHYPNGQEARYDYFDSLISGRLKQIKNVLPNSSVLSQFDYTYNPAGEITRWTQLQNGATTTWDMSAPDAYDADSELHKALQITTAGTTPFQWDYDKAGNRTTEFIGTASTTWATNNLNQLTSQNANAAILEGDTNRAVTGVTVNQTPVPTLGGNQFQTQIPLTAGANTVAIQASAADGAVTTNRYQIDNPATLGYDLAGNLTSTGSQILDYDAEQRLVQITDKKTSPATVTTMQYDGMWRRVGIKTTQGTAILGDKWYVWNDFSIAEERDASGQVIKKRYFGNGMRIEGATNVAGNYFYTKDKLQSIRGTIDSTGIVRNSFDYDSWGRRTKIFGDVDIDFGYTGNFEATNTNLSFAVFRAYAPELGRWLNRDPLESKDGVSPYLYVKNDPIGRRDPSGLKADEASVLEYVIKNKIPKDCSDRSKCFNDALESFHTCTKIAAAGTAGCLVGAALGCLAIPGYVECLGPALVICSEAGSAGAAACGVKLAVDFATCTQKQ